LCGTAVSACSWKPAPRSVPCGVPRVRFARIQSDIATVVSPLSIMASACSNSICHIGDLRAGRQWIFNHRFQHMRADNLWPSEYTS
jgi:hypothetical protein